MIYRRVTAPAAAPISVPEAKAWLRVEDNSSDVIISELIEAATSLLDGRAGLLGWCLEPQTWEAVIDRFPVGAIEIDMGPVSSVVSVTYRDANDVSQTVQASDYSLAADAFQARVVPGDGFAWPTTFPRPDAVVVRFVAGTGTPPAAKQVIRDIVAARFDSRGSGLSADIKRDIRPLRKPGL